ncbi:hypothetical protein ABR738_37390 [Streptomyces sp. Edi4]|uniref:hypothetical protein n=1 Tax=Streptomyces sp. Edi4 TaxID=3162527 RepID=UPI003305B78B
MALALTNYFFNGTRTLETRMSKYKGAARFWAQVNVRIPTREDLLTYYSNDAKSTPEAALAAATKDARSEHPQGQVVGHRVWSD